MKLKHGSQKEGVDTHVYYMVREAKHDVEKPYTLSYDPGVDFPRTNVANEPKDIHIQNLRNLQPGLEFEDCGFRVLALKSELAPEDFYHDDKVTKVYYSECKNLLADAFPGSARMELLQHNTRKKHQTFPIATGTDYEHMQPTTLAHIDYSPQRVQEISASELGIAPADYSRIVAVNLWKPIRGPVRDWPLALCDSRSVDYAHDTVAADIVERQWVGENMRLYHNSGHQWYYYDDLHDDEVILFRQSDSAIKSGGGVPHTGFPDPNVSRDVQPRESIEMRAFIYFV